MTANDYLLTRALKRLPVERTPAWMMRQAGRYLPEYRQVRAKAGDFMTLCQTPELACEVTLQPLRRFPIDAAILFSDILTIPDAMGLGLHFVQGEGPQFERAVRSQADVDAIGSIDPNDELGYVMQAVELIRREMPQELPLIGFGGSPWTLACYMVEGKSSRDFKTIKTMLYQQPDILHSLLDKVTTATIDYLNGQIAAGVNAVMVFDTWGGVLTPRDYQQFSLKYMDKIVNNLHQRDDVPVILFTKGGGQWLESIAATGCDAIGLDWTCDIASAKSRVGEQVALQGNMDPALLLTNPERIKQEVQSIIAAYDGNTGHVFNLGHGVTPDVPPENVGAMFTAIREYC